MSAIPAQSRADVGTGDTALVVLAGTILVVSGLLKFHGNDTGPLPVPALQNALGSVFPNPTDVIIGTVLLLAGSILYALGLPASPARLRSTRRSRARVTRLAVGLASLAAALYVATIALVLSGATGYPTGIVFLAALIFSSVTVNRVFPVAPLLSPLELGVLCVAAAGACLFYVHDAESWFFSWIGDEYAFYGYALGIAEGAAANIFQQHGVYGTHPVMDSVYQAAFIRVLGATAQAWRASSAFATAVAVFPVYLLGRALSTRLAGALAAGIFLSSHVLMAYAHIGYNEPEALLPLTGAVAFAVVGLQLRAPFYLFLAGVFAGTGWYTISTSRVAIGLLVLAVLIYSHRSPRRAAAEFAWIFAGFLLVLLPFILVNGTSAFSALVDQSRLGEAGLPPLSTRLTQNGIRSLWSFFYSADIDNHYVTGALFDMVSACFLALGMATIVVRRSAAGFLVFLCFWLLIALYGPTYYTLHLNTTRMYIAVPFASVIAGTGAAALIDQLRPARPLILRRFWGPAVAALTIALVAASNLYVFYYVTPHTMPSTPEAVEMKVIQEHPRATVIETGQLTDQPFLAAMQPYGVANRVIIGGNLSTALAEARKRGRPIIVLSLLPTESAAVPGRRVAVWDPSGKTSIAAVFVSRHR